MSNPEEDIRGSIAIRGVDGKYLKVLSNDGRLAFGSQKPYDNDGYAEFQVETYDNGKIGLIGANRNHVNMYGVDDVQCNGDDGGVEFGIIYLADGHINFTVSGYEGMGKCTKFLSSRAGSEEYEGSLAVVPFEDITCRFTVERL